MKFSIVKAITLVAWFGGLLLAVVSLIYGAAVYDSPFESPFTPLIYIGFGMFFAGCVFERIFARCRSCKKHIAKGFGGGLMYVIKFAKAKDCPHCSAELK